jgi:hypothetical protein
MRRVCKRKWAKRGGEKDSSWAMMLVSKIV